MNIEEFEQFLRCNAENWIRTQRDYYRNSARNLSSSEIELVSAFFSENILTIARIQNVRKIENPMFYADLEAQGISMPFDFTTMAGITFIDTILISDTEDPTDQLPPSLLFHELVHVVQYDILGVRVFTELYVRGWLEADQNYHAIPIELYANELEDRYERQPQFVFSVEAEVRRQLGLG